MNELNLIYIILSIVLWCCFCTCGCLRSGKPRSEVPTATYTTVVTTTPQQYPHLPTRVPGPSQSYHGVPYQPVPVQPSNPAQPKTTSPTHGPPFTPGSPPSYQEATGPAYPPQPMPYSQAAFTPSQSAYPLTSPDSANFLAHSAHNPEFVLP